MLSLIWQLQQPNHVLMQLQFLALIHSVIEQMLLQIVQLTHHNHHQDRR